MSIFQSVFLGLIQGLGEFLPVSSSGHLLLARIIFGIQTDTHAMKMLDILLHVGTLLPVLIVFRKEWIDMLLHPVRNKTLLLLIIASLPTLAVYFGVKKIMPGGFSVFDNGWFLGTSFLITAFFLLLCDRFVLLFCMMHHLPGMWLRCSNCFSGIDRHHHHTSRPAVSTANFINPIVEHGNLFI